MGRSDSYQVTSKGEVKPLQDLIVSAGVRTALFPSLLSFFCCGVTLVMVGALETRIVKDLALSHALAGLFQSAYYAGSCLGVIIVGVTLRRLGTKALLIGFLISLAAGNALCAVGQPHFLLCGRFLAGAGVSGGSIILSASIVRSFPQRITALVNATQGSVVAGALVGLVLVRRADVFFGGWGGCFLILSVACLGASIFQAARPVRPVGKEEGTVTEAAGRMLRDRALLATFGLLACYLFAEQGLTTFLPAFLEMERGFPAEKAPVLVSLYFLGPTLGRITVSLVVTKVGERAQIACTTLCGSLFLLSFLILPMSLWSEGVILLAGFALGPLVPAAFSFAVRRSGAGASAVFTFGTLVSLGGGIAAPALVGWLGDMMTLRAGLFASFLFPAGGLFAWLALSRAHPPSS